MKDVNNVTNATNETEYESTASRRVSQKRKTSMKGYYAIAFVFVSVIVLILCLTVLFNVHTVEVDGLTLYREDQICSVGGISDGENLMRTDTKIIEQRLVDNLVFIDKAKVEKKYPSTLVITITEAVKAADIECDGEYYVVSESGRILEAANKTTTENVPLVKGFELSSKAVGNKLTSEDKNKADILEEILKVTEELGFKDITAVDMTSRSEISIVYDNRITLEIGSIVDLDYKLNYFKSVIDEKLTDEFRGRLIFNGTESGISAIPDSADSNINNEEIPSDSSELTADSSITEVADAQTTTEINYGTDNVEQTYNDDAVVDDGQNTTEGNDEQNLDVGYGY